MALLQLNMYSEALARMVPVNVILPADGENAGDAPMRTMYLLHGAYGNYMDWLVHTRVYELAQRAGTAVVMPSGDNATYLDHENEHNNYGIFVGQELVAVTRRMFRLSREREDTCIAGLSMGGFGALRNGLKYHETLGWVAFLSPGYYIEKAPSYTDDAPFFATRSYARYTYGADLDGAVESDKNPRWLVEELCRQGKALPRMYGACGLEDTARIKDNQDFVRFLRDHGADVTESWEHGKHEWSFWDMEIEKVLEWFHLSEFAQDSGDNQC